MLIGRSDLRDGFEDLSEEDVDYVEAYGGGETFVSGGEEADPEGEHGGADQVDGVSGESLQVGPWGLT